MVNCKTIKSCASAVRFLFARKKHFLCEKMLKKMLKNMKENKKKCFRFFCSSQKRERFLVEVRGVICGKKQDYWGVLEKGF